MAKLTERQQEILALVGEGLTNKEVGQRLGIAPRTVSTHLYVIYRRLGVRTRTAALHQIGETMSQLDLTDRELKEIKHALFYADGCNHGTTGHNQLLLIAKLARHIGFKAHSEFSFTAWPDAVDMATEAHPNAYTISRESEPRESEPLDWERAHAHLKEVRRRHESLVGQPGVNPMFGLVCAILPLEKRYNAGERAQELFDEIMDLE